MSLSNTSLQTVAAHQQRFLNLDAGSELRCRQGTLQVRLTGTAAVFQLSAGQAIRIPESQAVAIESSVASSFWLEQPRSTIQVAQTQKNRQSLAALAARLWRSLATAA